MIRQILRREKGQANTGQDLREQRTALMFIGLYPAQARLKYELFRRHIQFISADQVEEFVEGERNELVRVHDSDEIVVGVVIGSGHQVCAGH